MAKIGEAVSRAGRRCLGLRRRQATSFLGALALVAGVSLIAAPVASASSAGSSAKAAAPTIVVASSLVQDAASPTPCGVVGSGDLCQSTNPSVTFDLHTLDGGSSADCTFTVQIHWGDGTITKVVNKRGSVTSPFPIAGHVYRTAGTYEITDPVATAAPVKGIIPAPTCEIAVINPPDTFILACATTAGSHLGSASGIGSVRILGCPGYFVTDSAGAVSAFGEATWHADEFGQHLNSPIIAITATADGKGYYLLGADGGIFTFGDAKFHGSTGGMILNAPVVGMAVTPDGKGYWIVAKDGGVFAFGDAKFHGSEGGDHLNQPVDGIAVAPGGDGYWLVASDGGVFTFTPYGFHGSHGSTPLNKPIVGMSSTPSGGGYTLVASDGGVFTYDAPFYGSLGADPPATPIVDLSPAPLDNGYYLVDSGGGVFTFGPGAKNFGGV